MSTNGAPTKPLQRLELTSGQRSADQLPRLNGSGRYSRSLEIGVAILQAFDACQPVLGVADVAELLGLTRSTTHRYLVTLTALGWLGQTSTRKYGLAPRAARPGMAVLGEIALASGCEEVLSDLRGETGCTASLGVLDGARVMYVRRVFAHGRGQYEADLGLRAGAHVPAHCTAPGKALLACLSGEELEGVLADAELARCTPRTVTSKRRLAKEIERVRVDGLAVSDREFDVRMCSVAVALTVPYGCWRLAVEVSAPVRALGVAGLCELATVPLREAAGRMGEAIGAA